MTPYLGWSPARLITVAAGAATAVATLVACGAPTDAATGTPAAPAASAPAAAAAGGLDADPSAMPGMAMPAAPAAASAGDAPVATDTVAIQNFAFSPATVTVKAGSTITWTNSDQDPHTVTSMNNGPLHSPPMSNGDTYRYTFTAPGRYEYLCTIHPFMTATVVVTP
jgi:plastocyanin